MKIIVRIILAILGVILLFSLFEDFNDVGPIVIIVLVFYVMRLGSKIKKLETKILSKEKKDRKQETTEGKVMRGEDYAFEVDHQEVATQSMGSSFVEWLKKDWLMKLGAFLLLIGFGWLVSYAFLNNWIGPVGRITIGIMSGIIILFGGSRRIRSFRNQGSVLVALGAGITFVTVYAARHMYDFFTPTIALAFLFLVIILVATISLRHKILPLAILGLGIGAIAPFLTAASGTNMIEFFGYLFLLCAGTLWVTALSDWRVLTPLSLGIFAWYSSPYLASGVASSEKMTALLFVFLFGALFYLGNLTSIAVTKKAEHSDLITAGANGLLLLIWIATVVSDEWQSLFTVGMAAIFAIGAFLLSRIISLKEPVYIYTAVALAMIGAATAFELQGAALTIAYTLEVGLITVGTILLTKDIRATQKTSMLLLIPIILSLEGITARVWAQGMIHTEFFVLLILTLVLLGLGLYFLHSPILRENKSDNSLYHVPLITGGVYGLLLLWLSLHAEIEDRNVARGLTLTIYTLVGLIFYIRGRSKDIKNMTVFGSSLLVFVVGDLLLIEVWDMNLTGRIITFFLIGALLISTAFIGKKPPSLPQS